MNFNIPSFVGKYVLVGGVCISATKKPNFIHRYFLKLFFGIKWENMKNDHPII